MAMDGCKGIATAAAIAVAAAAAPGHPRAGGIFVPGIGPQGQARAGAFVAKADDGAALAHNPAGFAKLPGTHLYFGANLIDFEQRFHRAGTYEPTGEALPYEGLPYPEVENEVTPRPGIGGFQALPLFALSSDFGLELPLTFAVGLFTPHGFSARGYAEDVDVGAGVAAPGPQRYDVFEQTGAAASPSVAVAYRALPWLDVGIRATWGFSTIESRKVVWAIRNYEEYREKDAVFTVEAQDWFIPGFGVGALARPIEQLEIGAAYNGPTHIRARGTGSSVIGNAVFGDDLMTTPVPDEFARCEPGGKIGALRACINVNLPMTGSVGARWIWREGTGAERADVELDVKWEDWSSASDIATVVDGQDMTGSPLNESVVRHGFRDVWSVRAGGSYTVPVGAQRWSVRGGVAYDTAAAPTSWTRLSTDGKERTTIAGGLAYQVSRMRIDLGGGVSLEPDREVAQCAPPDGPTAAMPGCSGSGDTPYDDRTAPDPNQPKRGPRNQLESPFNAGRYVSDYVLLHVGITTWF